MNTKVKFSNLVRQLVPTHKRQPVRLWWLRGLTAPLQALFDTFDRWRSDTRMIVNVTSQVAIFEGYLRKKYNQPIAIKLVTYSDGGLHVGLEREGQHVAVGYNDLGAAVPLVGELREQFGDADFIVYIPAGVDMESIRADIERFKIALTRYKIIQSKTR